MVARTISNSTHTQPQIVTRVFGSPVNKTGDGDDISKAINWAANTNTWAWIPNSLSQTALITELLSNGPVIASIRWTNGSGGHAIVVYGFQRASNGTVHFLVRDPGPTNQGASFSVTYNELVNWKPPGSGQGLWFRTIQRLI